MKKILFLIIIVLLSFLSSVAFADYQFPSQIGYVNDYAGVIDDYSYQYIFNISYDLEAYTGAEIVVVTLDSINESGLDTKSYAVKLFEQWQIGKKDLDNGLLVLFVLDQRRIEIEVGYGLEGILPDGKVGRILDDRLQLLKEERYSKGLEWIVYDLQYVIYTEGYGVYDTNTTQVDYGTIDYYQVFAVSFFFFVMISLEALRYFVYKREKCPKCKKIMKSRIRDISFDRDFIDYKCSCGYTKQRRTPWLIVILTILWFIILILARSKSKGKSGGGSSGGGGAGRSF